MIDYTVLRDDQTAGDIGATKNSKGFCLIYVEETLSIKSSSIDSYGSIGQLQGSIYSTLSDSSKQAEHLTDYSPAMSEPLTEFEYADQEINTGKYFYPLKEVQQHPVLQSLFMSKLNIVDSKLHDVCWLSRKPNL